MKIICSSNAQILNLGINILIFLMIQFLIEPDFSSTLTVAWTPCSFTVIPWGFRKLLVGKLSYRVWKLSQNNEFVHCECVRAHNVWCRSNVLLETMTNAYSMFQSDTDLIWEVKAWNILHKHINTMYVM